jgi:4-hydroxy-3-polyprenylbenzoate decarboxylase
MRKIVVGLSGASGVIYGIRLLEVLQQVPDIETHLVISDAACQTIPLETDYRVADIEALAEVRHPFRNIAAPIASGSFLSESMVVIPCSMKTLSAIASSFAENALTRAADVMLKEHRRLILVPRETPLHLGHLRLMVQAVEMGAILLPPIPAFYHRPRTIDDIIAQTVNHVLDLLNIRLSEDLFSRWQGAEADTGYGELA